MSATLIISIVNHSNPELLRKCLASISDATAGIDYEVHVIDNCTGGRMVAELQAIFPAVRWLFNDRRRGFSFNHNQVLNTVVGRFYCVLNDDTVLHPGSLGTLIDTMDSDPKIGLTGPRLLNADGTLQDSAFRQCNLRNELISNLILPRRLVFLKRRSVDELAQSRPDRSDVAWVLGACMVVRREALLRVGCLDAVSFPVANNEDIDWCTRIRSAEFQIAYVPSAAVTHLGGQSMGGSPSGGVAWMRVEMARTQMIYFRKHGGLIAELAARAIHLLAGFWNGMMMTQGWLSRQNVNRSPEVLRVDWRCNRNGRNHTGPFTGWAVQNSDL